MKTVAKYQDPVHFAWKSFFSESNRIEANFNDGHADHPVHDHEFMEIVVVVAGSALHHNALGDDQIGKGDAFIMRPGAWHSYENCQNLTLYNCCFDPGMLGWELSWMIDHPNLSRLLWSQPLLPAQRGIVRVHIPDSQLGPCREILDKLCALTTANRITQQVDRVGLLVLLLGALGRQLPDQPGSASPQSMKQHPAVMAALKLINSDPSRDWSLASLAKHVHTNPDYFARMFRNVVCLSPMAYLRRRRLEVAITLLANSSHTVSEVAHLVGWPDSNYFTRRFRAEYGVAPLAYRTRFLKNRDQMGGRAAFHQSGRKSSKA